MSANKSSSKQTNCGLTEWIGCSDPHFNIVLHCHQIKQINQEDSCFQQRSTQFQLDRRRTIEPTYRVNINKQRSDIDIFVLETSKRVSFVFQQRSPQFQFDKNIQYSNEIARTICKLQNSLRHIPLTHVSQNVLKIYKLVQIIVFV